MPAVSVVPFPDVACSLKMASITLPLYGMAIRLLGVYVREMRMPPILRVHESGPEHRPSRCCR